MEAAELVLQLPEAREGLSRLEITRETGAQVLAQLSASEAEADVAVGVRWRRMSPRLLMASA